MLESFNTDKFEYKRLSSEEQEKRGILGRLVGKIADTKNPTRNGRSYSRELWENVFNDPIMQEKIDNHLLLGELGHPEDREEIDVSKAAICMAERPKKGKDGFLYGVFDILNTPNGKILKSLCDYGCNVAISSRGTGDVIYNDNGDEAVDPDTYVCETFDIVLVPGVEQARLQYVNESLNTKKRNKTLRQKLTEDLNKASEEDKKIMEATLKDLDINLEEDSVNYIGKDEISGSSMYQTDEGRFTATYQGKTFSADSQGELEELLAQAVDEEAKKMQDIPEELEDNDGWGDEISGELEPIFDELDRVMYEVRNAVRGSYGIRGKEVGDLVAKLNDLSDQLAMKAEEFEEDEDRLNEDFVSGIGYDVIGLTDDGKDYISVSPWYKNKKGQYDQRMFDNAEDAIKFAEIEPKAIKVVKVEYETDGVGHTINTPYEEAEVIWEKDKLNESITIDEDCDNKEVKEDAGSAGLVDQLQEALTKSAKLEKDNLSLQEQLSVCNAKEVKMEESLSKYKKAMMNLSNSSKENNSLKEELNSVKRELNESKNTLKEKDRLIESTKIELENAKARQVQKPRIDESLKTKVKGLEDKVTKLNEQLDESSKKLEKTTSIAKKYKAALVEAKNMYINAKAEACGISSTDIKNKLKESYSFKDIDSICDELVREKNSLSKLPFRINEGTRLGLNTKGEYINGGKLGDDDFVSESLLRMLD